MAGQRDIPKELILQRLMEEIQKRNQTMTNKDKVNVKGKEIGIFTYKRNQKLKAQKLYYITWYIDNIEFKNIYDEDGDKIAKLLPDGTIEPDKNIELKKENLIKQLDLAEEREKLLNNENKGSSRAGDGRDLASKEHEENKLIQKEKKDTRQQQVNIRGHEKEKGKEKKLTNLKDKVSIYNDMLIPLYEIINGHYLWDILQIEEKLGEKLPENVTAKDFRTGFLCVVNSKELEAIDGKQRETSDCLAIRTLNGDMVELDETVLKKMPQKSLKERYNAASETDRFADGTEIGRPTSDTSTQLTDIALYEIPGARDNFSVKEQWFLEINNNKKMQERGNERASGGNMKEVYFVQQSLDENVYEREYNPIHTIKTKLEPLNEARLQTKEEIEQQDKLREKNLNETLNTRVGHINEIVDKCFEKYKDLGDYYNKADITRKVEKYHKNMSDEEVIEQIGDELEFAEKKEHDLIPGEKKH